MPLLQIPKPSVEIPPDSVILNQITEKAENFFKMPWRDKAEVMLEGATEIGIRLIAVVAIFIACRWLIRRTDRLIDHIFVHRHVDSSLNTFIRSMLKIISYMILAIIVISILGIKTTSLVAVFASAAFAVGMALSGTLQNFAGGIMILLLKPFRAGDYIQSESQEGTVKEIRLFSTILITSDNKTIIIPNGRLSSSTVNNFSDAGTRRVEWSFTIGHGGDYDTAKVLLEELLKHDTRILEKPPFLIVLSAISGEGITIAVRAWAKSDDYWDIFYDMNEKVYKLFPSHGLKLQTGDINVTLTTDSDSTASTVKETPKSCKPNAEVIKNSVKSLHCENNTRTADNSIKAEDII